MSMRAVLFVRNLRNPQPSQVRLLPIDKLVLSTIAAYVSIDHKREAWPSVRTLAADCWASERRVQRSLSRLEKAKLLHRECGGGLRTTTYRIAGFSPEPATVAATPPPKKPDTPPVSTVTPTPVTRDTHPPSPVTPPNKEYESTCERTLKGEIQPPPKTLASQVVNDLCLPKVLLPAVAEAIANEAKRQHIEPAAAARLISAWGAAEQADGQPVDRFAIEDMRWRSHGTRKQSAQHEQIVRNIRVVSEMFGPGVSHHGQDSQDANRYRSLLAG